MTCMTKLSSYTAVTWVYTIFYWQVSQVSPSLTNFKGHVMKLGLKCIKRSDGKTEDSCLLFKAKGEIRCKYHWQTFFKSNPSLSLCLSQMLESSLVIGQSYTGTDPENSCGGDQINCSGVQAPLPPPPSNWMKNSLFLRLWQMDFKKKGGLQPPCLPPPSPLICSCYTPTPQVSNMAVGGHAWMR